LIISSTVLGALYALLGVGLNIGYSTARLVNIAYGDLLMMGSYGTYWLFTLFNINPFVSLVIVGLIMASIAVLIYKLAGQIIIHQSKTVRQIEDRSVLLFFGTLIILQNLAAILWTTNRRAYSFLGYSITLPSSSILASKIVILVVSILTVTILYVILRKTRFGKSVGFVMQDKVAAAFVGINVDRVYLYCTMLSFAIVGVAGTLVSMVYEITPMMGSPYTMAAFVVIILAGVGSIPSSVAGGIMLGFIETFGVYFTTPSFRIIISYLVFMIIVILRPKGILRRGI